MNKSYKYYKRGFLNKNRGRAIFEADIEADGYYPSASFTISDCNRQVTLDFGFVDDKEFVQRRMKLKMLTEELKTFYDELIKAYEHYKALKDAK